ncbi:MAG: AsmA family protein, partial [Elusimicrobia bacterium]|nr:AsmA family protein [Elusimicrobiota bacterium]
MNRATFWLKAAAAAALVAALGAVAAVLTLKSFFPEPKLRAMTVDAAKRQLGRDVRLEGIGIGLTGVSLRGLEVSEKPDFAAGTFVRVESFRLRPSWKALLKRRLVVASVSADGLSLRVVKGADGRFNYETLLSSGGAPAAAGPSKPAEAAPELDVRRATVTRGKVQYADRVAGADWTASDLELDLRDFGLAAPFDLETTARVVGKAGSRPVDAKLAFKGRVDLARGDRAAFKAEVRKLVVEAEGARLSATGKAAGLDAPKVSFEAELSAAGKELLRASGTAAVGAEVAADVKAKTPGLDTTLLAKLLPQAGIPALSV